MVSVARSRKLEKERAALEAAYFSALQEALRDCAGGKWGLFGQNDAVLPGQLRERLKPESAKRLEPIAEELGSVRERLGLPTFGPMARLEQLRREHDSNSPGEQRLAMGFLEELQDIG
ncbi:MAG: hypothetical protein J0H53_24835 [Rhizobiales bacterium]|nr:hypothetical protein [Hyphomicrobiales bacterium]OJU37959.1 MAG: hypothetical protein BGN94_17480 [Rhizobiales bacterium 68-8]